MLGLSYDLLRFPQNEIDKGVLQMRQKAVNKDKRRLYWGPDPATLPVISRAAFDARVKAGEQLVILDGFALDMASFMVRASMCRARVPRRPPR